ncbi:MAG TPA: hypothetical protein VKU00_30020 [Chthonomonadaceae bacterium]|nr:hypothetical protein [Chthonomonadaceae bacterium]
MRHLRALSVWGLFGLLLTCVGVFAQPASADNDHARHHRHRVVRYVRVKRHGHWVTVRRVVYH